MPTEKSVCDFLYVDRRGYELIINRTNAYNYMSGFYFLATVFGEAVGSLLLSNHVYVLNGLSILCFLATAYIAAFVPPDSGRYDPANEPVEPISDCSEEDPLLRQDLGSSIEPSLSASKVPSPFRLDVSMSMSG